MVFTQVQSTRPALWSCPMYCNGTYSLDVRSLPLWLVSGSYNFWLCMKEKLLPGEKMVADGGYSDGYGMHGTYVSSSQQKILATVRARQETVNKPLKQIFVLGHRFRHHISLHSASSTLLPTLHSSWLNEAIYFLLLSTQNKIIMLALISSTTVDFFVFKMFQSTRFRLRFYSMSSNYVFHIYSHVYSDEHQPKRKVHQKAQFVQVQSDFPHPPVP